jgi:antitoxin component of RelBE/YafQ-DinJ toxin-antitoxin module
VNSLAFTSRELKGFNFENLIGKSVNEYGFLHNDFRGVGSDFKHECYPIEVEAKFSHAVIYPSWIKRDWISRFSNNAKFKVVVSNRGMKLSNECFKLLKVNRIIHVYFDQLKETIELLIALCSSEGVTSYRTVKGCKCRCYSVGSVKDYSFSVFNGVDLADDYSKFLFSQDIKSKLSEDTMKLLRKIHENNLPIEIIFINNQKEMDAFIESLKRGKDKAEDPSKYNENIDYKKEFSKTLKEIRRNKPKLSREEKQLLKFNDQLSKSIEKDGLIEPIIICKYGVISGESRIRQIKGLPTITDELYTPETANKFGFIWKNIDDEEQYWRMKITCGLLRKEGKLRKEVLQLAQKLSSKMPMNEVANYIVKLMDGIVDKRRIYEYLPREYKTSPQYGLPEGMNILQKPETVTFSIRTTKSQKARFYELCKKHGLQVNDVIKQLIDEWIQKMSTVTTSEGER